MGIKMKIMKLNDYVENKRVTQVEDQIDYQNNLLSQKFELIDFEKNFKNLVVNGLISELQSISKTSNDFDFKILNKEINDYPYKYKCEFNIWIELQAAQYYLYVDADPNKSLNSIWISVESSGYQRKLDEKEIEFENLIQLNFEEYLIDCVLEFEKYN